MSLVGERQVPLLDLRAQHRAIRNAVMQAVTRVVDSQQFILGEEVERLETELAPYCGAAYAVACASGSDALSLALMAAGIQPGDEVLTVPFTFFSTAGEIARCGAKPVFVDIEPQTFNMDMNQAQDALKRSHLRAAIPVHLFGGCADMDSLLPAAATRELVVIEDAAQEAWATWPASASFPPRT